LIQAMKVPAGDGHFLKNPSWERGREVLMRVVVDQDLSCCYNPRNLWLSPRTDGLIRMTPSPKEVTQLPIAWGNGDQARAELSIGT